MKRISIFNLRIGLACNSSSSHSILILEKGQDASTDEYNEFHWDYFTAANNESKNNYFMETVRLAIEDVLPQSAQKEFLGKFFSQEAIYSESSIDHQSRLLIPMNHKGRPNEAFIKDFQEFLLKPEVVIAGGNDNDDKSHDLATGDNQFLPKYPTETDNKNWIARKDVDKNYWTLFNKFSGSKMRFSFDSTVAPTKASAPELVDIKITDYCPYACEFCYQDSTLKGQHASMDNIRLIAKELGKAEVLEIAAGGGETSLHPNFVEILKIFHDEGIVVNFTTKNLNLLRTQDASEILKYTGAIAFSVENILDIEKVYSACLDYDDQTRMTRGYGDEKSLINLQFVMGTTSIEEFRDVLMAAARSDLNLTLLGYKENGRGQSFSAQDYSSWLDVLKDCTKKLNKEGCYPNFSMDTALAGQYKEELLDAGVKSSTFHTTEGTFSMYIDAVANTMSPSSYIGMEQTKPFDSNWLENYKSMGVEAPAEKPKKKIKIKG